MIYGFWGIISQRMSALLSESDRTICDINTIYHTGDVHLITDVGKVSVLYGYSFSLCTFFGGLIGGLLKLAVVVRAIFSGYADILFLFKNLPTNSSIHLCILFVAIITVVL